MREGRWQRAWAMAAVLLGAPFVHADEGMWLYTDPPRTLLKERYGFEPTQEWLDHLRESSVRFNSGGSGSFVSADGLVMTNHHVGADALQKLSTKDRDLIKEGFHAKSRSEEFRCVDLELNVLMSIEDVTDRVNAAVQPDMDASAAQKARRAVINTIEKESLDKTKMRSDVVTLYQGGLYHLYRYKRYTDVRLVFAPEKDIAFFGGDPDNFEFPRYDLDVCFFRAYENDQPARPKHFLRWSKNGARDGDLIFVSGHPGKTDRLNTLEHLIYMRDRQLPLSLDLIRRREVLLENYAERSIENARRAQDELFSYKNSRKARLGQLQGLQDPAVIHRKAKEQSELTTAVRLNQNVLKDAGPAWNQVSDAIKVLRSIQIEYNLFERGMAFNSELFTIARALARHAEEKEKPNAERLREHGDAGLESLQLELFSTAPIYRDLEATKLADSLAMLVELAGADHPIVPKILAGQSPIKRAQALISQTKLDSVDERKKLFDTDRSTLGQSSDPMIQLALLVDPTARNVRKTYEEKVEEPLRQAYAKIARARFAVHGRGTYPDATFTLRLALGTVKGYLDDGKAVAPLTTIGGAFDHSKAHGEKDPYVLPPSWIKAKDKLNLETPFNFVSTADIIGGNSGSPVVNRDGEVVGIIFDGNIQSLVLDFLYSDDQARAVSVHSAAIIEALKTVYEANDLVKELTTAN